MNKEINSKMIDELLKTIPKQNNQCISTYGGIDVDNLKQVVDKFKKIPNYDELIKINNNLEQALDEIKKILRQPQFEYDNIPCNYEDDIEKIKEIIQKA